jgi:hypothetical protein
LLHRIKLEALVDRNSSNVPYSALAKRFRWLAAPTERSNNNKKLLQRVSPLLAQSGHHDRAEPCPLLGKAELVGHLASAHLLEEYPRFLSTNPIPSIIRSWILHRRAWPRGFYPAAAFRSFA